MTTMPIPSSAACWRRCLFPPPLKDPPRGVALLRPLAGLLAPLPSLRLRYRGLFCSSPPPSSSSSSSSFEEISGRSSPALHPWLRMEHLWAGGSTDKNKGLVEQLKRYGIIKSNKIAEVMQTIDRAIFVPEDTPAYVDSPMPIGFNATISAPHMHATCLELLKDHLQPGMHALDVGSDKIKVISTDIHFQREALMSLKPELFEGLRFDFTKGLNQKFSLSHRDWVSNCMFCIDDWP